MLRKLREMTSVPIPKVIAAVALTACLSGVVNPALPRGSNTLLVAKVISGRCPRCAVPFQLTGVQFLSSRNAWSTASYIPRQGNGLGTSTILNTADGGRHWHPLPFINQQSAEQEPALFFLDADHGWIASLDLFNARGRLSVTADGGRTWSHRAAPVITKLGFFDALNGWAICIDSGKALFRITADGGVSWRETPPLGVGYVDVAAFADPFVGAIAGSLPADGSTVVRITGDGGQHWTAALLPSDISEARATDIAWIDARAGLLVLESANGSGSLLLQTQDGGMTWARLRDERVEGSRRRISALTTSTSGRVYVFSDDQAGERVAVSLDRGQSWQLIGHLPSRVSSCRVRDQRVVCTSGMSLLLIADHDRL